MTTVEFTLWDPAKISFEKYEALLNEVQKYTKLLRRACESVQREEDSLSVLEDEIGSPLWDRHQAGLQRAKKRAERYKHELDRLDVQIKSVQK